MLYRSTRGEDLSVSSSEAIKMGLAPDGGLFVPASAVTVSSDFLAGLVKASYHHRARAILELFLTDFTPEELDGCVAGAYSSEKFNHPDIAPVVMLNNREYILELWHGPTCAFKDMALQILPRLMPLAATKTGEQDEIVILVATSGDTGKAALEGFMDVPGTRIIVFYPEEGVSQVQKTQMVTQEGRNVSVVAVRGNFDDAQTGVKEIFSDRALSRSLKQSGYRFSSANSINWGRLVPQIVYYFSAYLDLIRDGEITAGQPVNFVVPTGNFGNILAGCYARRMGLPVGRLICAANRNNVLTDFIRTGVYDRNRAFHRTTSPSMDILISSNLERLLFEITRSPWQVGDWMRQLRETGRYTVDPATRQEIQALFWSDFADDLETARTIRETYLKHGYVMDTHTAVGRNVYTKYRQETADGARTILVSTASPFKFNESVVRAILGPAAISGKTEFQLLEVLSRTTGLTIPRGLLDLDKRPVLHSRSVAREEMKQTVISILG